MRTIAIASITFATLSLATTAADAAPWCANYGGRGGGGTNCGFYSFQQCMAAAGTGGFCTRNQFEIQQPQGERRYRRDW
jgi:Protein of unknown function (DUF3551)